MRVLRFLQFFKDLCNPRISDLPCERNSRKNWYCWSSRKLVIIQWLNTFPLKDFCYPQEKFLKNYCFGMFNILNKTMQSITTHIWFHRRRQSGEHRNVHSEMEKNCCRKVMLFPKALFLATTFPNIASNSIFQLNFYQKFLKISQNFPTICVFVQTREKLIHGWLNILKNMLK